MKPKTAGTKEMNGNKISDFNMRIYMIVMKIPIGKVMTYGQIAAAVGSPRASRAVGTAMRFAPEYLNLSCHRVVNKYGEMAPDYAFGGADAQREKLEEEGILFNINKKVDMEKSMHRVE